MNGLKNSELYIITTTIIFAVINFYVWAPNTSHIEPIFVIMMLGVWLIGILVFFYPALLFIKHESWEIKDFGIVSNRKAIIVTLLTVLIIVVIRMMRGLQFSFDVGINGIIKIKLTNQCVLNDL